MRGAVIGESVSVDYETEAILLDFSGGGQLPGKEKDLLEPRSILVADKAGNITIRNELDDEPDYHWFIPSASTSTPTGVPRGAAAGRDSELSSDAVPPKTGAKLPPGGTKKKTGVESDMQDRGKTRKTKFRD